MNDVIMWLLALTPIVVVLVLMVGFRLGGSRAGPVGWLVAGIIAVVFFGAGPVLLIYSQLKAVLLTLYVLYIIWMALVLYNVVNEAGAITVIGQGIARLTGDRVMQLLILAWVFSAFLQGVAGFGVPIAVVAPLLIGLGFDPVTSVAAVAIGHSWSVTFGDIASSFQALIAVTGLSGLELAPWSAAFLAVECFGCGLAAVHTFGGTRSLRHSLPGILIIGAVMSGTQYLLATNGLWNLAGFVAGLVGLAVGAVMARLPLYSGGKPSGASPFHHSAVQKPTPRPVETAQSADYSQVPGTSQVVSDRAGDSRTEQDRLKPRLQRDPDSEAKAHQLEPQPNPRMGLTLAVAAYVLLVLIVVAAELWAPLHGVLNAVVIRTQFPELTTARGWVVKAGPGRTISVFGHAGALLAYSSFLAYLIYRWAGTYSEGAVGRIVRKTLRSAVPSSIGIASMVGMALFMDHSGMTYRLAQGLSQAVGSAFPAISPLIGVLGAFMTGSNTNSNVIFAPLQKSTAELVGISTLIILGAQTAGGSLGSMLAPAKVIVGCSTAGLAGREGHVLRITLIYGLLIAVVLGVLAWVAVYLG